MPGIIIESGAARGRQVTLPSKATLGIGRDAKCAIRLEDDQASRIHCVLRGEGNQWLIEDRNSANGTWVNGKSIKRAKLAVGDMVRVGETSLSFVAAETDPLLGKTLAGYRIEHRLGRGATGTVYQAVQLSLGRTVAMKLLAPKYSQNPEFVRRFLEEARAAARLNHPNVVQVYDAGSEDDQYFISMEFCDGGTLQEILAEEGTISPERAVEVGTQAARALGYAERQGIVHRDIKPANLLLDENGTIKVGDLGIAADLSAGEDELGRVVGSPRYLPPEQALGQVVDHRADIYSLGATLFRALTGEPPFDGPDIKTIIKARIELDSPSIAGKVAGLPPALAKVIDTMMAYEADDRYDSATELEEAFGKALAQRASPGRRSSGRKSGTGKSGTGKSGAGTRRARARRAGSTAASSSVSPLPFVLGGLALIGIVVFVLSQNGKGRNNRSDDDDNSGSSVTASQDTAGDSETTEAERRRERRNRELAAELAAREGDLKLALSKLEGMSESFNSGQLTPEAAKEELDQLLSSYPSAQDDSQIQEFERRVAQRLSDMASEAAEDVAERIAGLLEKGDTAEAAKLLREFRGGDQSVELAGSRDAVSKAVNLALDAAKANFDAKLAAGDVASAKAILDDLEAKYPGAASPTWLAQLDAREAEVAEAELAVVEAKSRVWKNLAALDFAKAREALQGLPADFDDAEPLRQAYAAAEKTWIALQVSLASSAKKRSKISVSIDGAEIRGRLEKLPELGELLSTDWPVLRLKAGTTKRFSYHTVSLLSLEPEKLLAFAKAGGASEEQAALGVRLLLSLRRGTEPEADYPWREGRFATLDRVFDSLRNIDDPASVPGDAWAWVRRETGELITSWRSEESYADARKDLRNLWGRSRTRELSLLPPTALFHAKNVKMEDGRVTLAYDFSDREQLQDFNDKGKTGGSIHWVATQKAIEFRDEARFAKGNPFLGELGVEAAVVRGGTDAQSPNVNVALWTSPEDYVTPSFDLDDLRRLRRGRGEESGEPSTDYIVVGHGYHLEFDLGSLGGGAGFRRLAEQYLPRFAQEPIMVIFGGARGKSLHRNVYQETIWDSPAATRWRDRSSFKIRSNSKTFDWSVDGRPMPFGGAKLAPILVSKRTRKGSISFFTNGKTVRYGQIHISGTLDPEWVGEQLRAQVKEELNRLDPKPSTEAEAPDDEDDEDDEDDDDSGE